MNLRSGAWSSINSCSIPLMDIQLSSVLSHKEFVCLDSMYLNASFPILPLIPVVLKRKTDEYFGCERIPSKKALHLISLIIHKQFEMKGGDG